MNSVCKVLIQSVSLVLIASVIALAVNTVRPDGLPLVQAKESVVQLDAAANEIAVKDAAMLFITKRAVFLDARSFYEYEQGHIMGAISAPSSEFDMLFDSIKPQLEGKEAIIAYCDGVNCPLSAEVIQKLRLRGYENVWILKDGWDVWNTEKLPIEEGDVTGLPLKSEDPLCVDCGS